MKVATWNVNSVTARLPLILKWLESARPDVLCLQEIKCVEERFPREAFHDLGYVAEVFGQPTYNGVAILSRKGIEDAQRGFPGDLAQAQARLLAATIDNVRVINVYIPNGGFVGSDKYTFKLDWMRQLRAFLDSTCKTSAPVLLCGDFNVAPEDMDVHDPELWRGQVLFSDPEREALDQVRGWGFIDLFRLHNPAEREYSWWDYRAGSFRRNAGLRIDHLWGSEPLAARSTAAFIDKEPRRWERPSDHAPVIAEFE
ncbi:MAG TPA: exodeoxyribonuclease III [Blastocatellia bacterium]|nr:exodeoxyribonuclease III [Blastocatellia bacterium]